MVPPRSTPPPPDQRRSATGRRAFTLIELVTSLTLLSFIALGLSSAMVLAVRSLPGANEPLADIRTAKEVLAELADDLSAAVHITERTANAMTFTIADRDQDGLPEVIRYAWAGSDGDPLTRRYNGQVATLLDDVQDFALRFDLMDVVEKYEGVPVTGSEIELSSHSTATNRLEFKVKRDESVGQHFQPTLPVDATGWSVTRVFVKASEDGAASGETLVQLRPADAGNLPTGTVLEERSMFEAALPASPSWQEFAFTKVVDVAPEDGLCLVLERVSGGTSAAVEYDGGAGAGRFETFDAGATWASYPGESLLHYVYGTVTTEPAAQYLTRQHVTAVQSAIQIGTETIKTSVHTLNLPEALDAVWEADFGADPTLLDLDADDVPDWTMDPPGPFPIDKLSNGWTWAEDELWTNPGADFDRPTTVDLRFRDEVDEGEAGGIKMRVDRTGSTYAYLQAEVELAGATQTLTVQTYDTDLNYGTVHQETLPAGEAIDLRILVDPDRDTFNVRVNDRDAGTFAYGRITASKPRIIGLYETATMSGVRFDWVRVRLGGTSS